MVNLMCVLAAFPRESQRQRPIQGTGQGGLHGSMGTASEPECMHVHALAAALKSPLDTLLNACNRC